MKYVFESVWRQPSSSRELIETGLMPGKNARVDVGRRKKSDGKTTGLCRISSFLAVLEPSAQTSTASAAAEATSNSTAADTGCAATTTAGTFGT